MQTNTQKIIGKLLVSAALVLFSCFWITSVSANGTEKGILKLEYQAVDNTPKENFLLNETTFANPDGNITFSVVGIENGRVDLYDGANQIATKNIAGGESITIGENTFVGTTISATLSENREYDLSTKVYISGGALYKEYEAQKVIVDTVGPSITVKNNSRWKRNSSWVRNELQAIYAEASDTGSGINPQIISYDLFDITSNTSIKQSGDRVAFSSGSFFLTPENGFQQGTFTDSHRYRATFTIEDNAGNISSSAQEFTVDYQAPVIGDDNAYFAGGNRGDTHVVGVYDPNHPDCDTNNQCKSGGSLPGYMPYTRDMNIYTNPSHFAFWVDTSKIKTPPNHEEEIFRMSANSFGWSWNNKGGRNLYDTNANFWIDHNQGLFKTIEFMKNTGANRELMRFDDHAFNRGEKYLYYVQNAGGPPQEPKITNSDITNLKKYKIGEERIPDLVGTVVSSTEDQLLRVRVDGVSGDFGEITIPAGETSWSMNNDKNLNFSSTFGYYPYFHVYLTNSYGTSYLKQKAVNTDFIRPEVGLLNISENENFRNSADIEVSFSATDGPFHPSVPDTVQGINYTTSSVKILDENDNEVLVAPASAWQSNRDSSYSFIWRPENLSDGNYKLKIQLVDIHGNTNETDTTRNFSIGVQPPTVQINTSEGTLTTNQELHSTYDISFNITALSGVDLNPENTYIKFYKNNSGNWELVSLSSLYSESISSTEHVLRGHSIIPTEENMKLEIQVSDRLGNTSGVIEEEFRISPRSFNFTNNNLNFFSYSNVKSITSEKLKVGAYTVTGEAPILCKVTRNSGLEQIKVGGTLCTKNTWTDVYTSYDFTANQGEIRTTLSAENEVDGVGEVLIFVNNGLGLVGKIQLTQGLFFQSNTSLNVTADQSVRPISITSTTNIADGEEFTLILPDGINVENAINNKVNISNGVLTFNISADPISSQSERKTISFFQTSDENILESVTITAWKPFTPKPSIDKIEAFDIEKTQNEALLDTTPEFFFTLPGIGDDLSRSVRYKAQISDEINFSNILYEKMGETFQTISETTNSTSASWEISASNTMSVGQYYIRVQSIDEASRNSVWSNVFPFEVAEDFAPNTPSSIQIQDPITEERIVNNGNTESSRVNLSFSITDQNTEQPVGYKMQLSSSDDFSSIDQELFQLATLEQGTKSIAIQALAPGQTYYLRLQSLDSGGHYSAFTNPISFSIIIPEPIDFYIKANEYESNETITPTKKYTDDPIVIYDRYPIFGWTLPAVEDMPIFMPHPVTGKAKLQRFTPKNCTTSGCETNKTEDRITIKASNTGISETRLFGILEVGDLGYIYLDRKSVPAKYLNKMPLNTPNVANNGHGKFSGKAWSNTLGWVSFGTDDVIEDCTGDENFTEDNYGVCINEDGQFKGFAKVEKQVFPITELQKIFTEAQWSRVKDEFFIIGNNAAYRIFEPTITDASVSNISDQDIRTKMSALWNNEIGGFIEINSESIPQVERFSSDWRRDGIQKPISVDIENDKTNITIDTIPKVENSDKDIIILSLSYAQWEVTNTYELTQSNTDIDTAISAINAMSLGDIIIFASKNIDASNSSKTSELLQTLEGFGSEPTKVSTIQDGESFIFIGRKGKKIPMYESVETDSASYVQSESYTPPRMGGTDAKILGLAESQSLGHIIFSDYNGGADFELGDNGGIIGTMWTEGAGPVSLDSDNAFGSTHTNNDYGVTVLDTDAQGNTYFEGRAWGDATGFIEISRGSAKTTCEEVITPDINQFGVCRDNNGSFHGYAWSPSFGWISFEKLFGYDPLSSSGYKFMISESPNFEETRDTYTYEVKRIPSGEINLSTRNIIGGNCVNQNAPELECGLSNGRWFWKVQTYSNNFHSGFSDIQKLEIKSFAPEITHQCLDTIPVDTTFNFSITEINTPPLPVEYDISFVDINNPNFVISSIFSGDMSTQYLGENSETVDFSGYNGRNIQYTITAENEGGEKTSITCGGTTEDTAIPIRSIELLLTSPTEGENISQSHEFAFKVETKENDEYDAVITITDEDDTNFTPITQTITESDSSGTDSHEIQINNLPIGNNICWEVEVTSTDTFSKKSNKQCFSVTNNAPEIENVEVYGNNYKIAPFEAYTVSTGDRNPRFKFDIIDDSEEIEYEIRIVRLDQQQNDIVHTGNISSNTNNRHSVSTEISTSLPDDIAEYEYRITASDNSGETSAIITGNFNFYPGGDIGFGNIGTEGIHMDESMRQNGHLTINHRYMYDTQDGESHEIGWINLNPEQGGVHISSQKVYGYAWNTNTGFIRFNCSSNPTATFNDNDPIKNLVDTEDSYCQDSNGNFIEKYGVYPGVLAGSGTDFTANDFNGNDELIETKRAEFKNGISITTGIVRSDSNSQDLLGKARFEIIEGDAQSSEFLYFDILTYLEDFPNAVGPHNWPKNLHGERAVGIDEHGKLSGYAWSPSFGWIYMGIGEGDNEFSTDHYFPITEYIPTTGSCSPELTLSNTTRTADENILLNIAAIPDTCEESGKISSCSLYLQTNAGNPEPLSLACTNVTTIEHTLTGVNSRTAETVHSLYGEIVGENGQTITIPQEEAIQIKIIAQPTPDFTQSEFIIDNETIANGRNETSLRFALKDKFDNPIYEDTDISGNTAKDIEITFAFKDNIRFNQLADSITGGTTDISITPAGGYELTETIESKTYTAETVSNLASENTTFTIVPFAPTSEDDIFKLESLQISITDETKSEAEKTVMNETFTADENGDITLFTKNDEGTPSDTNIKSVNTVFEFSPLFTANTIFDSPFDESSAEPTEYSISITQNKTGTNTADSSHFHFLHCLYSDIPGSITFDPIQYESIQGKQCFEISKNNGQNPFWFLPEKASSAKPGRPDYEGSIPFPNEHANENTYEFSASATRKTQDIPTAIGSKIYTAFTLPEKTDWILNEIDPGDNAFISFIMKAGYIEGKTHGSSIYESEVSNKSDGIFSKVGNIIQLETIRNALYKELSSYANEKGGRGNLQRVPDATDSLELSSTNISNWLQSNNYTDLSSSAGDNINFLDNGNMLWIKGDGDLKVVLGDDTIDTANSITDSGIEGGTSKTIVIEGGNVEIKSNILKTAESVLAIIVLRNPEQVISTDGTDFANAGNILISPKVTNIRAMLYADGSIFSYGDYPINNNDIETGVIDGYIESEYRKPALSNQLYILGSVASYNTYGGASNPERTVEIDGEDIYVNTLEHRRVYHNSNFEYLKNDPDDGEDTRKAEAIRFDLKELREFSVSTIYLDDDDNDGIRDTLGDIDGDGTPNTDADKNECNVSQPVPECLPVNQSQRTSGKRAIPNFRETSYDENDVDYVWEYGEYANDPRKSIAVIFEYDNQIILNPAPGTSIYGAMELNQ